MPKKYKFQITLKYGVEKSFVLVEDDVYHLKSCKITEGIFQSSYVGSDDIMVDCSEIIFWESSEWYEK